MSGFDGHSGGSDHGPSFADTFVGVELAAGLTGHQVSIADAATAAIAIGLAAGHGGSGQFGGYQTGSLGEALGVSAPPSSGPDAPIISDNPLTREVAFPGIARDNTAVEVLFWPHEPCDPQERIRSQAARDGLLRFAAGPLYNFLDIDRAEPRILFGAPRGEADGDPQPPNGWYPGASGTTHLWREFFRVRPASLRWLFGGPDEFATQRTFLMVTGVTWHYRQANDDETRVAFQIYAGKYVNSVGTWVPDEPMVARCRKHAESLAADLQRYLQEHRAPPDAVERHRQLAT